MNLRRDPHDRTATGKSDGSTTASGGQSMRGPARASSGAATGWFRHALWGTVATVVFLGPLDVSADGATMTVGLDATVLAKLGAFAIVTVLAAYGILTSWKVRELLQSIPAMMVLAILVLVGIAGPTAISGASIPTTLINVGFLCFVATVLVGLGVNAIVTAALTGTIVSAFVAWALFLLAPRYGVFPELLADGLVIHRMGGIAHPNSVTRSMLLGAVFVFYLYKVGHLSAKSAVLLSIPLLSAAWFAWSRTAIIAGGLAVFVLTADRLKSRLGTSAMIGAGMAGMLALTMMFAMGKEDRIIDGLLSKISKSGDAEEITSGTGRSEIWSYAIHLISQRPIIGHGFNAAPVLMINHSQSTHNAILHAALAGGVLAGGLMVLLLAWNVIIAIQTDNMLIRALTTFIIISCLMEDTVLETFPGPCSLSWLMCSFYPMMQRDVGAEPATAVVSRASVVA